MTDVEKFEIIDPYVPHKGKFSIYFIETHIIPQDKPIEIKLDSKDLSTENLTKLDEDEIKYDNKTYKITVYKFNFKPSLIDKKKLIYEKEQNLIEIKIILSQNKCHFESISKVNIEKNNFLGVIKFSDYKWYLGMKYHPPAQITLTNLEIMKYFMNTILKKKIKVKIILYSLSY